MKTHQTKHSIQAIQPIQVQSKVTGELFTVARSLTDGTGVSAFSTIHEELAPGHRTSSPHSHSKKDEMYFVLLGTPSMYVNGEKSILQPGDYAVFIAGLKEVHFLANETLEKIELLQISSCPSDDVIEFKT